MQDKYQQFSHSFIGKHLCKALGFPVPAFLERARAKSEQVVDNILVMLANEQAEKAAFYQAALGQQNVVFAQQLAEQAQFNGIIFDATTIEKSSDLGALHQCFHQYVKQIKRSGKIVIVGLPPQSLTCNKYATAQRSLVGFVKSLAKEVGRKGITANLIYCEDKTLSGAVNTLRFFQSYRSAYVNGQVVEISKITDESLTKLSMLETPCNWQKPLQGKTVLVTGASRGIGAEIVQTLARDGAQIIGLDIPQAKDQLEKTLSTVNGKSLLVDISSEDSPETIAHFIEQLPNKVDVVVHNAGITLDKMLSRMSEQQWQKVIEINLASVERINEKLLNDSLINDNGRIIGVSSISGIAGNVGQTNYATSKAGIIGMVKSLSASLQNDGKSITVNAVAPGFIETEMTAKIPFMTRQVGRRLCSLSQAGLPVDVAETVAFIAAPSAFAVSGNVIRVCGQNLLGA